MNKHGQAAKFAYNPEAVLAYLKYLDDGKQLRVGWSDNVHGRTVRRWRTAKGITRAGLNSVLSCYPGVGDGDFEHFERWARKQGLAPILRDK